MDVPLIPAILLIFARIMGLVGFAPGWGGVSVSVKVRVLLSVSLTAAVTGGLFAQSLSSVNASNSWYDLWPWLIGGVSVLSLRFLLLCLLSLMVGVLQALVLRLLLTSLEYAGGLISQSAGLSMAEVFDARQGSTSLLAQWFLMIGVLLYFSVGGDHLLLNGLMDELGSGPVSVRAMLGPQSVDAVPNLSQYLASESVTLLLNSVVRATWLGLLIVLPAVLSLLVVYLGVGLISRLVPAWSFWNVGLPVVILAGILVLVPVLSRLSELIVRVFTVGT